MRNKVLVVDDMELNRELLAEILKDEYDIAMAENGISGKGKSGDCSYFNGLDYAGNGWV